MKIKVHEIEGDYYCAIDDVSVAISKAMGQPRSREWCLADLIQDYDVFLYCLSPVKYYKSHDEIYCPDLTGLYKIAKWVYPCTGLERADEINLKPTINILEILKPKGTKVFASFEGFEKEEYCETWYIEPAAKDCFIALIDAKICLADVTTDDDFIMPNSEPTTPKTEPIAEQPTTGIKPPYLNEQSEYFPPYLAIAIDIWERAYIHGEAKETSNKLDPIIKLVEIHYPQIETDTVREQIASIIVTKRGTPLDELEAKPRQSKKVKK